MMGVKPSTAIAAQVGDGERAALHVVGAEASGARLVDQRQQVGAELAQRAMVRVLQHGHDEAFGLERHRHADVHVI